MPMALYSQSTGNSDVGESVAPQILIVGDSLSAAYKLSADQGWVARIAARARGEGYRCGFTNTAVSGATTATGIDILSAALKRQTPALVVLGLGGNDGLQGKPVPYITRNLERLIGMADSAGSEILLLGVRIPPNFGERYTEPFFAQYGELAKQFSLHLVPFVLDGIATDPLLMMSDGIHPNAEGQKRIVDNVWPRLRPLLDRICAPESS